MSDKDTDIFGKNGLLQQSRNPAKSKLTKQKSDDIGITVIGAGSLADPESEYNRANVAQRAAKSRVLSTIAQYINGLSEEQVEQIKERALKSKELPSSTETSNVMGQMILARLVVLEPDNKTKDLTR